SALVTSCSSVSSGPLCAPRLASRSACLRPVATTLSPARSAALAISTPSPRLAPVMNQVLAMMDDSVRLEIHQVSVPAAIRKTRTPRTDDNDCIFHDRTSGLDHHLDRFALVHRAIAVGNAVEVHNAVEDAAWLNPALHDIGQKLFYICPHWRGTACDRDVTVETWYGGRDLAVLRYTYAPDGTAGPHDADCGEHCFIMPHALEHRVCAEPLRELLDAVDCVFAALAHNVRGAEFACKR